MQRSKVQIVIWAALELRQAAQARAAQEEQSLSSFLRQCLIKYIAEGPWFLYAKRRPE